MRITETRLDSTRPTTDIRYTDHARIRMQQRAIPEALVEALIAVGKAQHDHHGAVLYYLIRLFTAGNLF